VSISNPDCAAPSAFVIGLVFKIGDKIKPDVLVLLTRQAVQQHYHRYDKYKNLEISP
jgi:hypothetical protein